MDSHNLIEENNQTLEVKLEPIRTDYIRIAYCLCAVILTISLIWPIFQLGMLLKNSRLTIDRIDSTVKNIDTVITEAKPKLTLTLNNTEAATEQAQQIITKINGQINPDTIKDYNDYIKAQKYGVLKTTQNTLLVTGEFYRLAKDLHTKVNTIDSEAINKAILDTIKHIDNGTTKALASSKDLLDNGANFLECTEPQLIAVLQQLEKTLGSITKITDNPDIAEMLKQSSLTLKGLAVITDAVGTLAHKYAYPEPVHGFFPKLKTFTLYALRFISGASGLIVFISKL